MTPLLLSNTLSSKDYGLIEYSLSLGVLIATLISLGVPSSYPYFRLKRNYKTVYEGFSLHKLYLLGLCLLAITLSFFLNSTKYVTVFIISYIISNQVIYSIRFKSSEKILKATLIDSGLYIALLLGYIVLSFSDFSDLNILIIVLLVYVMFFIIMTLREFYNVDKNLIIIKFLKLVKYGLPLVVSGFLMIFISNSGRIVVDFFLDPEDVGIYSFYFRISSLVLIAYQVFNIVFFKKIYTLSSAKLDKIFIAFFLLIIISTTISYFITPILGKGMFKMFSTLEENRGLHFLLSYQVVCWISLGIFENMIYRENLTKKMNKGVIFILMGFLIILFLFRENLTIEKIVLFQYTSMFLAITYQLFILYNSKKIKLLKTYSMVFSTYFISMMVYFYI
ncbi:oligosaccharide flippase family protein [Aquimarina sp. MMG015]|nr:oligosaccharide flippase family protein [Aquimarina sp. MMG015]